MPVDANQTKKKKPNWLGWAWYELYILSVTSQKLEVAWNHSSKDEFLISGSEWKRSI